MTARFHWTTETNWSGAFYTLRDGRNYARALVVPGQPPHDPGFYGQVIATDMPDSGPYKSRQEAADWVAYMLVHLGAVPAGSEFGLIPQERRRECAQRVA